MANEPEPTLAQLYNLIARTKTKVGYVGPVNTWELKQWCTDRPAIVESGEHDVTIPFYDANPDRLHLFLTTKNLMKNAAASNLLQADTTFQINWHKYPGIVVGAQDADRVFHPFGIHIVWKDEDTEIYNSVFDSLSHAFHAFGLGATYSPQYDMADGHADITFCHSFQFHAITAGHPVYAVEGSACAHDLPSWIAALNQPQLFQTFDQYQAWLHDYHLVEASAYGYFTCNCFNGMKKYRCSHSVGIEVKKHGLAVPALALGAKRKPERPRKPGPALSMQ